MKALAFKEFGGPEKLALADVPDPVAGPGEVLVRVRACALSWSRRRAYTGESITMR